MKLSVVIPARNEAETIEHTLREIADNLESLGIEHEIIVVDDASSDGTAFVVERTCRARPSRPLPALPLQPRLRFRGAVRPRGFSGDRAGYTAAAKCLADDHDALVVHLRYLTRHRCRWRSTNLLERSLGEVKRRTKVIGRFPGETSCLTLVWAVLDSTSPTPPTASASPSSSGNASPHEIRRPRTDHPRGGERRLD